MVVHIEKIDAGVHVDRSRGRHRCGTSVVLSLSLDGRLCRRGGIGGLSGDQVATTGDTVGVRYGGWRRGDGRRSFVFNNLDFFLQLKKSKTKYNRVRG